MAYRDAMSPPVPKALCRELARDAGRSASFARCFTLPKDLAASLV